MIAVVLLLFHGYFYAVHLDRAKAEELRIPLTHWVMMSLENGYYNPEDYAFTQSFTDKAEQKVAIDNRIKERVAEKGASGMLRLFYWKGIVAFGDGTWAQSDFLDDNPENTTALHAFVLYDGRYYPQYRALCSGSYFTLQALMLLSAYGVLLQRTDREELLFVLVSNRQYLLLTHCKAVLAGLTLKKVTVKFLSKNADDDP